MYKDDTILVVGQAKYEQGGTRFTACMASFT